MVSVGGGAAPGPARLPRAIRDELVAWSRAGYPNEACGVLSGTAPHDRGGVALAFHGLTNAAASPYRYLIDPQEQLGLMLALDDADEVVWGIFHSHVRSPAVPSPTDIGLAFYPDALYLLCSLADMGAPIVRAWRIRDGAVTEVPLEIDD
ncbi:MAG: Mov34/MPN/PAD-1 family protein [Candidatus Limnocylindrales bacterium]